MLQECVTADLGSQSTCTILWIGGMCRKITEKRPENSSAIESFPLSPFQMFIFIRGRMNTLKARGHGKGSGEDQRFNED